MKKCCLLLFLCFVVFLSSCSTNRATEYKQQYFSNKDEFIKISKLLIKHYEGNDLKGRMSIWCSGEEANIFYDNTLSDDTAPTMNMPFEQSELDDIYNFIHGSIYECVEINENFIEFGNSTGSVSMYLCLTDKKPEKISKNHKLYDFGEGWYFSISITR